MKKKQYNKPVALSTNINEGVPTMLAIGAVSAAIAAASIAVGKMVGRDIILERKSVPIRQIIGEINA
ncbi:hypothetical protein TI04_09585 [Achromatium sp. WMS2]|nr:hypothetical protein TI04_09585 [Achromatium sp. WMS2]